MKDFFHPIVVDETKQRILRLHCESKRQWGRMTIAQTLAHCTAGLEMAMGIIQAKRAPFPATLLGLLIKPLILRNDKPMRRNSPSKGGRSETLMTRNPKASAQQIKTPPEIVELVDKLLDEHVYSEIAGMLNERGFRPGASARPADRFSAKHVAYLMHTYGLRSRYDRLRQRGMLKTEIHVAETTVFETKSDWRKSKSPAALTHRKCYR